MRRRFYPGAKRELQQAFRYYEQQKAGLGKDFLSEVESVLEHIQQFPLAAPLIAADARRARAQRFPYHIIYRLLDDSIIIVAVMHRRKRPGYWKDRL